MRTGRAVAWSSSAPAIATVDGASGVVMGVAAGTTTITATSEGKTGSTTATTVSTAVNAVDQILLAPVLDTIEAFSSEMIGRVVKDANGNVLTGRSIQWTSSNPAVAAIDPTTGMLTGVDRGTVTSPRPGRGRPPRSRASS